MKLDGLMHQPAVIRNSNGEYNQIESSAPPLGVIKQKHKDVYNIHKNEIKWFKILPMVCLRV